jgi:hypothetical protein
MYTVSIFLTVLGPRTDSVRIMYKIPENADHGGLLSGILAISLFIVHYSYIGNTVSNLRELKQARPSIF